MSVIRHRVYLDQLLTLFPNDASDVSLKLFFEVRSYQTLPNGDREDRLNVDLRECVCHLLPREFSIAQVARVYSMMFGLDGIISKSRMTWPS